MKFERDERMLVSVVQPTASLSTLQTPVAPPRSQRTPISPGAGHGPGIISSLLLTGTSIDYSRALPIFHWRNSLCFTEDLGKIAQGRKPQELGNLGHGKIGFGQKILTLINALGDHIVDGGNTVFPLKCMG